MSGSAYELRQALKAAKEIEEDLRSRILGTMQVNDNTLNCRCVLESLPVENAVGVFYEFTLNGRQIKRMVSLPMWIAEGDGGIEKLANDVAEDITTQLLSFIAPRMHEALVGYKRYRRSA